ncbi:MAG: 3-hydroxyacyl-CoA dehydrogenase family protein [Firmicutes bacterium]|nr:3-hydroxyacyl-CoA dehydrogenase family protein [Bacillota bacterium]
MEKIRRIAILGSGRLGRGIAENAATKGYDVTLFAQGAGSQNAPYRIERSLDKKLEKWAITEGEKRVILSHINYSTDLKKLVDADLVIEATIDHLYTKQELLRTADRLCGPNVIFLLTSATLCVSEIALSLSRPNLLVGARFIPPVVDTTVVELSFSSDTSKDAINTTKEFINNLGKKPILVQESPGLVNPRTLVTLINEAAYLLDEGVSSAEAIEMIIIGSWSMQQGPFEMADRMGIDIILNWMEQLQQVYGDRYMPAPIIRRYVQQGRLGVKTGIGFFRYNEDGQRIDNLDNKQEEN